MQELLEKIGSIIKSSDNFLVTSHPKIDGDGVGSILALGWALEGLGKKYEIVVRDGVPQVYTFIPGSEKIRRYDEGSDIDYDVLIALDCTGIDRIGIPPERVLKARPIVNIDHHIDNKEFGTVNLNLPSASSTAELLYDLLKKNNFPIDENAAVALYVGIVTDTGRFSYSNTTAESHAVAADLISSGVRPSEVYRKIYQSYSPGIAKLRALASLGVQLSDDGRLAWSSVTNEMFRETGTRIIDTQEFSSIPLEIEGVEVAILFMEMQESPSVKVSFRSKGKLSVNAIARIFGGGGHRMASGCIVDGTLEEVRRRVLAEARKATQSI